MWTNALACRLFVFSNTIDLNIYVLSLLAQELENNIVLRRVSLYMLGIECNILLNILLTK